MSTATAMTPSTREERIDPRRAEPGVSVHPAVPRSSLWEAMARAAVVLCPAMWDEPFGMVAAEAQACGTPVVAFKRGALGEVIVDGLTGFLVAPGDIQAAADAVRRATGLSRSECRAHAERNLDLERSLEAHEQLYRRVVGAACRGRGPWLSRGIGSRGGLAVVTGASRGIGAATAEAIAAAGAHVVLAARDREALDAVAERIRDSGGEATPAPTDVSDVDEVERLFAAAEEVGSLAALVCAAGVLRSAPFARDQRRRRGQRRSTST